MLVDELKDCDIIVTVLKKPVQLVHNSQLEGG